MDIWHRIPVTQQHLVRDQWRLVVNIGGMYHHVFHLIPDSLSSVGLEHTPTNYQHKQGKHALNFLSDWSHVGNDVPLDKVHHISCLTAVVPDECDERIKSNNKTINLSVPREWFLYRYPCFCKTGKKCNSDTVFRQKQFQAVASESLVAFWPFDNYFRADEMTKGQTPDYDPDQPNQSNFNIMNFPLMQYQYNWFCTGNICGVQFVRKNKLMIENVDIYDAVLMAMFHHRKPPLPRSLFSYSFGGDRGGGLKNVFTLSFFIHVTLASQSNPSDILGLTRNETDKPWAFYNFRFLSSNDRFCLMNGNREIKCHQIASCLHKNWCGLAFTIDSIDISIFEIGHGKLSTFANPGLIEFDTIHIHRLSDEKGNLISYGNHPGIAVGCLSIFNKLLDEDEISQLQESCEKRGGPQSRVKITTTLSTNIPIANRKTKSWSIGRDGQVVEGTTQPTIMPTFSTVDPVDQNFISLTTIAVVVILLVLLCCACICVVICRRICGSSTSTSTSTS